MCLYDGDSIDVLYETDGDGKAIRQYVYSDSGVRLAMKMNGKTLYYHYNAHGDVVALTDEAGKVIAEYAYDAWGNVLKSEATTEEAKANPYGYAGYTYDKEIEQYYLMARYYEPEQGVFTAVDPDPGDEDDPQTMNGYNYANNTPVMYMDPDGNFAIAAPVIYWGASAAIAAAPFVGYGIGKAGSWVSKKAKKRRKAYKTLWKYRKPIAKAVYKKSRKLWNRTIRRFSKGGKRRVLGDDPALNDSVTGQKGKNLRNKQRRDEFKRKTPSSNKIKRAQKKKKPKKKY
ncbi:hypothetical protein D8X92_08125 [Listeria ivanovii]|nr:hypothetical protein [Listeria ivanovii]